MASHVWLYVKAWAALAALLGLTVAATWLPLGPWAVVVNLAIAVAKALIVVLVFMRVREEGPPVWVAAGGAFYWLGILLVLALSDFATRGWMPLPGK